VIEAKHDKWAGSLNPSSADQIDTSRRTLRRTEHPFNNAEIKPWPGPGDGARARRWSRAP